MGLLFLARHSIKLLCLRLQPLIKGFFGVTTRLEDKDLLRVPVLDGELAKEGADTVLDRHLVDNHNPKVRDG